MSKKMQQEYKYPNQAGGIYRYELVEINGIKQYIQIRGESKHNPLLLVVHGGPGGSLAGLAHEMQSVWEKKYTVVNWDQRNTCKTLLANKKQALEIAKKESLQDYMKDMEEILQYLHSVYDFEKIVLLGFSWGTILASEFARNHADQVERYIGVGQLVDFKKGLEVICDQVILAADEKGDAKSAAYMKDLKTYFAKETQMTKAYLKNMQRFAMLSTKYLVKNSKPFPIKALMGSPLLNFKEKKAMLVNNAEYNAGNYEVMMMYDFTHQMNFAVPVTFVYGKEDISSPSELMEQIYDQIEAPKKQLVKIEAASHMCFYDQPEEFFKYL